MKTFRDRDAEFEKMLEYWGELHKILRHKAVDLGIPVTRSVFAAPGDVA